MIIIKKNLINLNENTFTNDKNENNLLSIKKNDISQPKIKVMNKLENSNDFNKQNNKNISPSVIKIEKKSVPISTENNIKVINKNYLKPSDHPNYDINWDNYHIKIKNFEKAKTSQKPNNSIIAYSANTHQGLYR